MKSLFRVVIFTVISGALHGQAQAQACVGVDQKGTPKLKRSMAASIALHSPGTGSSGGGTHHPLHAGGRRGVSHSQLHLGQNGVSSSSHCTRECQVSCRSGVVLPDQIGALRSPRGLRLWTPNFLLHSHPASPTRWYPASRNESSESSTLARVNCNLSTHGLIGRYGWGQPRDLTGDEARALRRHLDDILGLSYSGHLKSALALGFECRRGVTRISIPWN